jgi:hypothetical protein
MRNVTIHTPHQVLLRSQFIGDEQGGACSMHGKDEKSAQKRKSLQEMKLTTLTT